MTDTLFNLRRQTGLLQLLQRFIQLHGLDLHAQGDRFAEMLKQFVDRKDTLR